MPQGRDASPSKLDAGREPVMLSRESNASRVVMKGEDAEVEIESTQTEYMHEAEDESYRTKPTAVPKRSPEREASAPRRKLSHEGESLEAKSVQQQQPPAIRRDAGPEQREQRQERPVLGHVGKEIMRRKEAMDDRSSAREKSPNEGTSEKAKTSSSAEQRHADSGVAAPPRAAGSSSSELDTLDRPDLVQLIKSLRAEMQDMKARQIDTENKLNRLLEGMRGWAHAFLAQTPAVPAPRPSPLPNDARSTVDQHLDPTL